MDSQVIPKSPRKIWPLLTILLVTIVAAGCGLMTEKRTLLPPERAKDLDREAQYLQVHLLGGSVYILENWEVHADSATVVGTGRHLDWNRELLDSGSFRISIDSVAIFETNVPRVSGAIVPMTIVTIASVAISIVCIADPKACFGSCPTFYVQDGDSLLLQAEGFSSSVAPSLERTDIDALSRCRFTHRQARLIMTNEAYETHVVRTANLLALPRPDSTRVLATPDGEFRLVYDAVDAQWFGTCCDYSPYTAAIDGREWFTLADSVDLATKDTVNIEFERALSGELGLTIACRQTLMSTYLFYKTLAFMGVESGAFFAALERQGPGSISRFKEFGEALSNIEVWLPDTSGGWYLADAFRETGPLAVDVHLIRLGKHDQPLKKLQLRLTRGCWRIDQAQLVRVGAQAEPIRLMPTLVKYMGEASDSLLIALADTSLAVTSMPGDTFELIYDLPQSSGEYEYFLEARGYYLEWMREEWKADYNPAMAQLVLFNPAEAMKQLAPEYKRIEADLERYFWSSRYARNKN